MTISEIEAYRLGQENEREQLLEVINVIKTEIESEIKSRCSDGTYCTDTSRIGLRIALNIIDKHISGKESEDERVDRD